MPPPYSLTHTPINMEERMSYSCGSRRALAAAVLTLLSAAVLRPAEAHPGCKPENGVTLIKNPDNKFCPTDKDPLYDDGFCCNAAMEDQIELALGGSGATGECATMYQEVRSRRIGAQKSDHVGGVLSNQDTFHGSISIASAAEVHFTPVCCCCCPWLSSSVLSRSKEDVRGHGSGSTRVGSTTSRTVLHSHSRSSVVIRDPCLGAYHVGGSKR